MYTDEVRTPQALRKRYYTNLNEIKCRVTANGRRSSSGASNRTFMTATATATSIATPTNNGAKTNRSKTSPQMCGSVCTPPPKRLQKVRNPFEGALTERLHLPLIASPSLFQCRTRTPQLCSTQFEWDIEEVSQLKPADVEPHETQFHDSPDPEQESKAQMAISTFFKESHIVPSPVDCPLRKHRIILNEINDNTPISNKTKPRLCDCEVQTELTLPPILPEALEEALRPYFKPHLAGNRLIKSGSSADLFNSSMRRKLFDLQNIIVLEQQQSEADQVQMVGSSPQAKQTIFAGRLSDELSGSSSFGCLSPIRNLCGLPAGTPDDGNGVGSSRKRKQLLRDQVDLPSPIAPSEHLSRRRNNTAASEHVTLSEITGTGRMAIKFTPDRSSSPMTLEYSTDTSINQRVSRLMVNSAKQLSKKKLELALVEIDGDGTEGEAEAEGEEELDCESEEDEEPEIEEDIDGMQMSQMSQMSTHSFNCSSSNSDTPRGHRQRRSANRKNLSRSFCASLLNEPDSPEKLAEEQEIQEILVPLAAQNIRLYRTDSGFNETNSISNFACSQELPSGVSLDVSMACCSTPSKRS